MKTHRWDGTATALSSISHGGETLGTITYLRREAFLTPTGRIDVPVISGNAVRGVLRDTGAHLTWEALGKPLLPVPVMHALWAGGALVKAKGQPLTGQRLADLRRMVAHVGVFGAAGGGRIIDGALTVGKLVPICAQTAHVLPEALRDEPLPDMYDLLQIERYSRQPDGDRLGHVIGAELGEDVDLDDGLMRYGTETFVAGTRFTAMFALGHATDDEYDYWCDVLNDWLPHATVGGKTGRGHGRVRFELTTGTDPSGATGNWRALGGASTADAVAALSWLD